MSPINTVRIWEEEKGPAKLDIAGVTVLDYMDLYKRYSPKKLERYSLDFVSKHELEKGKVDYSEYKDLNEFYNKNHDLFIEYNVMDTIRPKQLEEKLGYIKLVQSLSLLCKVPMKFYVAQTQLIEGLFIAYFRRNGLCAPHFSGGKQETFEAAYVKEPQSGMYDWICDFDITSSYPTHIIALNMSKETYFGRITGIPEDKIIFYVVSRNFPSFTITKLNGEQDIFEGQKLSTFNALLERRALAVAPNGSVFRTKPEGVLAKLERSIFDIRKDTKKRMIKVKQSLPELRDVNLNNAKERIEQLNSIQNSLKIVMNAQFGITAVPYSRYFNVNLSEAIASCGRITVRYGEKFINEFFQQGIYAKNKEMKDVLGQMGITEYPEIKNDMVAYGDTDSLYVKMGYFMDVVGGKIWQELDEKKKIHYLIRVSRIVYEYINDREYKEIQRGFYNSAVTDFKITFKQEMVAKTALFVKKKKYSMWIVDEEGATVDEIKTKGLEIIRSETPEAIRPKLKEIMEMILKRKSDNEITEKINTYKAELMNCIPEEISMNIGIRGMSDYIKGNVVLKGAPWHVKGVHAYRYLLKHLKLTDKYEELVDGNKTKVVYLKPNVFGFEEVSFLRWPKEFDRIIQIDYNKQIENNFTEKIKMLLAPMNKTNLLNDSGYRLSLFFK
jgi:DNA polymerase elongation subunit (family B)